MSREASFWRRTAIIGIIHLAVLLGLAGWSGSAKKPHATDIIWMDGSAGLTSSGTPIPAAVAQETPETTPAPIMEEPAEERPIVTPAKSEIELPTPAPLPTVMPAPRPTSSPGASPKPTPKPSPKAATPKPTPKKMLVVKVLPSPKSSATPRDKKVPETEPKKVAAEASPGPNKAGNAASSQEKMNVKNAGPASSDPGGADGRRTGPAVESQAGWYSNMLHDRFFGEWVQPKTALATGTKMSTLVQLRIEKDGRVSEFTIVRSSGNVVVDESVAAAGKRVTRVDPPPAGVGSDGHYDVKINFELNVEQ